jgi:hypothetical protein
MECVQDIKSLFGVLISLLKYHYTAWTSLRRLEVESTTVITVVFQKLRGDAGSKRYGMDFFVHVNEKKKIREIITVYAPPVNGKIHSKLL